MVCSGLPLLSASDGSQWAGSQWAQYLRRNCTGSICGNTHLQAQSDACTLRREEGVWKRDAAIPTACCEIDGSQIASWQHQYASR